MAAFKKQYSAEAELVYSGGDRYGKGVLKPIRKPSDVKEDIRKALVSAYVSGRSAGLAEGRSQSIQSLESWIQGARMNLEIAAKNLADIKNGKI